MSRGKRTLRRIGLATTAALAATAGSGLLPARAWAGEQDFEQTFAMGEAALDTAARRRRTARQTCRAR